MCTISSSNDVGTDIEESLSILLDDEAEQSHFFVDQSTNALLAIGSDHNKHQRRASYQNCKPSKSLVWHGSCASFGGNNSELLNLSSSWNDSNELCMYLALHKNDRMLGHTSPQTPSSKESDYNLLDQETKEGETKEKYGLTHGSDHMKLATKNINRRLSLNETRFNSSTLLSDRSDKIPTKPKRERCNYDDDGDDAGFTDIITTNPYESICTTLSETLSIVDQLFEASASTIFDDASIDTSYDSCSPNYDLLRKIALQVSPERSVSTATSETATTNKNKCNLLGHSVPKEDEAPKRPTRGLSPPRFICLSYDGVNRTSPGQ
jgi:hypothetical protein